MHITGCFKAEHVIECNHVLDRALGLFFPARQAIVKQEYREGKPVQG